LNYAASAAISCFQAFHHRFLPEMQVLSGIEKLEIPCQEAISHQSGALFVQSLKQCLSARAIRTEN